MRKKRDYIVKLVTWIIVIAMFGSIMAALLV